MANENTINRGGIDKAFGILASVVAVALCLFHLVAASPFLTLNNTEQSVYHGALIITFFLLVRGRKSTVPKTFRIACTIRMDMAAEAPMV